MGLQFAGEYRGAEAGHNVVEERRVLRLPLQLPQGGGVRV